MRSMCSRNAANIKIRAEPRPSNRSYRRRTTPTSCSAPSYCGTPIQRHIGRRVDREGHNGAAVRHRSALWIGPVDPVLMNANAAADRMSQLEAALKATISDRGRLVPGIEGLRSHRHAQHRAPIRRQTFRYRASTSVRLDFSLRPGELVFITGGNGSGKSTFLRVLGGLDPPNSGEVTLDGMRINDHTRDTYRCCFREFS